MAKKLLKVLIKEPDKEAYIKKIENTLAAKQAIVGGWIECVKMPGVKDVDLFVNEEGKLDALKGNFWLPEYEDCVVGTAFMVGYNIQNGEDISITDKQIEECKKYIDLYSLPQGLDLYQDFHILQAMMNAKHKTQSKKLQANQL